MGLDRTGGCRLILNENVCLLLLSLYVLQFDQLFGPNIFPGGPGMYLKKFSGCSELLLDSLGARGEPRGHDSLPESCMCYVFRDDGYVSGRALRQAIMALCSRTDCCMLQ